MSRKTIDHHGPAATRRLRADERAHPAEADRRRLSVRAPQPGLAGARVRRLPADHDAVSVFVLQARFRPVLSKTAKRCASCPAAIFSTATTRTRWRMPSSRRCWRSRAAQTSSPRRTQSPFRACATSCRCWCRPAGRHDRRHAAVSGRDPPAARAPPGRHDLPGGAHLAIL